MRAGTLSGTSNSGTILNVGTPDFSTGHRSRSTTSTWNSRSQCELTATPLSGKLGADHSSPPTSTARPSSTSKPHAPPSPKSPTPDTGTSPTTTGTITTKSPAAGWLRGFSAPPHRHRQRRSHGDLQCRATPGQLAAQDGELLAHVERGDDGPASEVLRADQDGLVRDGLGPDPEPGQRLAQRQHVHGGLDRGRRDLVTVPAAVDDRERLDLDDAEPAVDLE